MKQTNFKTKQILLSVILVLFVGTLKMNAQQTAWGTEMRIGNRVYLLDMFNYYLVNKANKITNQEINDEGCIVSFDNSKESVKAWEEHFKSVFSKERAKELNFRVSFRNICDATGRVKEVEIYFRNRENFEKFTLSEINAMEDAAKKHQYKVKAFLRCEGNIKYFTIVQPLNPYLLYFEKPKE